MDLIQKVEMLGEAAQYDLCGVPVSTDHRRRDRFDRSVYPASLPNGKRIRVLKVLQTNICEKRCGYCGIRASRDVPRASFESEELARAFDRIHRAGIVDGLFLSSGVCTNAGTMDRLIATVEIIRRRYEFAGYVHLKILPGASEAHIERAVQLAHRVSVNLEAPNPDRLSVIAPHKDYFGELSEPMRFAQQLIDESGGRLAPAGQTTQFVVGAAGESDSEILSTSARLYEELGLARAYYLAFNPVPGTPLDGIPPTPQWRERRLYQADWLLRFYGFSYDDLVFDSGGYLSRTADPKLLHARNHPQRFPVELNRASRRDLLRVPGLGPRSIARILHWRRQGTLRELEHVKRAGGVAERAAPYILLDGKRPPHQLTYWDEWPE
ncbi:radical SAM protein [Chloroflexota bacterium]